MYPHGCRLAGALFILTLVATVSTPVAKAEGEWCGGDATRDWVCPLEGSVYAAKRLLRPQLPVPINNRRLATLARSSAHLTFGDRARCTLGELSEVFPGGLHTDSIFTQRRGSASCWSNGRSQVGIACRRHERCPTEVRADGTFLFKSYPPSGATPSMVTVKRQRLQVVSCQGSVEVRVVTPSGVQKASGGGSAGSRLVIEIEVFSKLVERPWGVVSEEFATIKSEGRAPALEECEGSAVQEEEEIVRP